jgi:carbonic anhydrase
MEDTLRSISVRKLKLLAPEVHNELVDFCSELDKEEYPEATIILSGKKKDLIPLLAIYERLGKDEKRARKHLKKAEKLILSMESLTFSNARPARHQEQRPASKLFPNSAGELGQDMARRLHTQRDEELRQRLNDKVKEGKTLGRREVLSVLSAGYAAFLEKVKNANPFRMQQPEATVIMCSDARQPIGDIALGGNIEVLQVAGNSFSDLKPKGKIVVFVGHGGPRCGAVAEAEGLHKKGKKAADPDIAAITTDSIAKDSVLGKNPELENAVRQAMLARKAGYETYAIYADLEEKGVVQVHGGKNRIVDAVVESIGKAVVHTGNLAKQTAGFVILTRSGRVYSGKTVLDASVNTVFETNFTVDEHGEVGIGRKARGSLKYALSNITGVKDSKNVVVLDPDPKVVKTVSELVSQIAPGANVLSVQEDWKVQLMREIGKGKS